MRITFEITRQMLKVGQFQEANVTKSGESCNWDLNLLSPVLQRININSSAGNPGATPHC